MPQQCAIPSPCPTNAIGGAGGRASPSCDPISTPLNFIESAAPRAVRAGIPTPCAAPAHQSNGCNSCRAPERYRSIRSGCRVLRPWQETQPGPSYGILSPGEPSGEPAWALCDMATDAQLSVASGGGEKPVDFGPAAASSGSGTAAPAQRERAFRCRVLVVAVHAVARVGDCCLEGCVEPAKRLQSSVQHGLGHPPLAVLVDSAEPGRVARVGDEWWFACGLASAARSTRLGRGGRFGFLGG
eukprot:scaffold21206_cov112-Isochrysis_galbana.AAC.2